MSFADHVAKLRRERESAFWSIPKQERRTKPTAQPVDRERKPRKLSLGRRWFRKTPGTVRREASHRVVAIALSVGWLTRADCEQCGASDTVAHHDDYQRPLDVRWLCHVCHRRWHWENGEGANP